MTAKHRKLYSNSHFYNAQSSFLSYNPPTLPLMIFTLTTFMPFSDSTLALPIWTRLEGEFYTFLFFSCCVPSTANSSYLWMYGERCVCVCVFYRFHRYVLSFIVHSLFTAQRKVFSRLFCIPFLLLLPWR